MRPSVTTLMECSYMPDWLFRLGIRRSLAKQVCAKAKNAAGDDAIAHVPDHEAPIEFLQNVLGPRLYDNACWWPKEVRDLETAEAAMLAFICERTELGFDQDILDFGCGWGALTLWLAEFYPDSRIVAVAGSDDQREWIAARCQERGLKNVAISPLDAISFGETHGFDRVMLGGQFLSRGAYPHLGQQLSTWLKPDGKLFLHGAIHRQAVDLNEKDDLPFFQDHWKLEDRWDFDGCHYQRTLEAWLANQDRQRKKIMDLYQTIDSRQQAERRFRDWRYLFMARAEAFGYRAGQQWAISHYLFIKT